MGRKRILKRISEVFVFCLILLLSAQIADAAIYYVDKNCSSYTRTYNQVTQACSGGGDVVYPTIQGVFDSEDLEGGDIVEVRATSAAGSAVYAEKVSPGENDGGTSGFPVILRARTGDTITITGSASRTNAVYLSSVDYFTIDGFNIQNTLGYVVSIRGRSASSKVTGVTIQNCIVTVFNNSGGDDTHDGIVVLYGDDIKIYNNTVQTIAENIPKQTDCIYVQASSNVDIFNNILINRNNASTQHNDGVQIVGGNGSIPYGSTSNITIRNNTIVHDNTATSYRQLVYIEYEVQGYIKIYNNVLYSTHALGSNMLGIYNNGAGGSRGDTYIYNNSFYCNGEANAIVTDSGVRNSYIKNNLIYINDSGGSACIYLMNDTQTADRIDYNQCYKPTGSKDNYRIAGTFYTFAEWQVVGFDIHGYWGDPQYVSISSYPYNLQLQSSSSAIDNGVNLSSNYTTDHLRKPRQALWDIGAYEYKSVQSTLFVTSANGTVTSNPSGINCGTICYANYDAETSATLAASPNSGYTFTGWSGGGCSGTGACTVNMASAQVVTANYVSSVTYKLSVQKRTVTAVGGVSTSPVLEAGIITARDGSINCGSVCSANYGSGKTVTLVAKANSGYTFSRWVGGPGAIIVGSTCTMSMTAARYATALFLRN